MRKKVIQYHFYRKFDDFKKVIFDFFENIKDFEAELQNLISCNFRTSETKPRYILFSNHQANNS
jgi:hypothetical protein